MPRVTRVVNTAPGTIAQVISWLDDEAIKTGSRAYVEASRQGELFSAIACPARDETGDIC